MDICIVDVEGSLDIQEALGLILVWSQNKNDI